MVTLDEEDHECNDEEKTTRPVVVFSEIEVDNGRGYFFVHVFDCTGIMLTANIWDYKEEKIAWSDKQKLQKELWDKKNY